MVKVDWLLVEVASLTVGGGYEARPLVLCWSLFVGCLQVRARKQVVVIMVVVRRRLKFSSSVLVSAVVGLSMGSDLSTDYEVGGEGRGSLYVGSHA